MSQDKDYILGTNHDELKRLGLQHNVWRPYVTECWQRAGISTGHSVLDVGAGPGYATLDLAEMVGEKGKVYAIEKSAGFTDWIKQTCIDRKLTNVTVYESDLINDELPDIMVDFTWCRWVASFVSDPGLLIHKIGKMLPKGGSSIFFEYGDYSTWRLAPQNDVIEKFVDEVMQSWRDSGGEPDIALKLPSLLVKEGFRVRSVKPHIFCIRPNEYTWKWPAAFIGTNLNRLTNLGRITTQWAKSVRKELEKTESNPNSYMITPLVLEIIAEKI